MTAQGWGLGAVFAGERAGWESAKHLDSPWDFRGGAAFMCPFDALHSEEA
jgi:hypothetical protein